MKAYIIRKVNWTNGPEFTDIPKMFLTVDSAKDYLRTQMKGELIEKDVDVWTWGETSYKRYPVVDSYYGTKYWICEWEMA